MSSNVVHGTLKFFREVASQLTFKIDLRDIDSVETLTDFASTRAAFIAQKTLYGYLKTRMGTRYPSMFEDSMFVESINIAKINIFSACLSDMSIYAVAYGLRQYPQDASVRCSIATRCFKTGFADNADQVSDVRTFSIKDAIESFNARLSRTDWNTVGTGCQYFSESPKALVKWAPVAAELKQFDTEIVSNSIILAWHGVRQQFAKRLHENPLCEDISSTISTVP